MGEYVNIENEQDQVIYTRPPTAVIDDNIVEIDYVRKPVIIVDDSLVTAEIKKLNVINNIENPILTIDVEDCECQSESEEEVLCIKDVPIESYYGNQNPDGSFKRENLFSELTDEYQRAIARHNLGIGDNYGLIWGNIKGNILKQSDLYKLISSIVLSQLYLTDQHLINISLNKEYMFYGEVVDELTCQWEYDSPITSQKINGTLISNDLRGYTFYDIKEDLIVLLEYTIDGKHYAKTIMFLAYYPIYYGASNIYEEMIKTKDNTFVTTCNLNEYLYLAIPNGEEARIAVDGIVGGFITQMVVPMFEVPYYVFRSKNSGLGKLHIEIKI